MLLGNIPGKIRGTVFSSRVSFSLFSHMAMRRERTHSKAHEKKAEKPIQQRAIHAGDFEMRMSTALLLLDHYWPNVFFRIDKSHGQNMLKNPLIIQGIVDKVIIFLISSMRAQVQNKMLVNFYNK